MLNSIGRSSDSLGRTTVQRYTCLAWSDGWGVDVNRNIKGIQRHRTAAWKVLRSAPSAFAFLLLAACGGGGGSGSGPGSSLTMSVSPQTLSVSATTTQAAPTSSFQVNVTGLTQGQLIHLNGNFTTQGISSASFDQGGVLPATVTIQFKSPASLGAGTFNDTVTISACLDQACTEPASNSPQKVQVTYTITKSTFAITALTPSTAYAGTPGFTLTVTGSTFTQQSTVLWNGNSVPTTFVSSTQLTTQIPASDIATPGSATVEVSDPNYGTSNTETFTITPPPLAITSLSPTSVTVGGPSFILTVLGTAYTGTSTVQWNGTALVTTLVSSTELIAKVPASNISTTGTASVTVVDPNSPPGTTSPQTVTIVLASKDAVTFQINSAHTGAVTFNSVSFPSSAKWSVNVSGTPSYALIVDGKVIVTVDLSTGGNANSEVIALDQTTGNTVWGPILFGGFADASYDSGRVFVVSGMVTAAQATLQAFDVNTGALDWSTELAGSPVWAGLPIAVDGTVYVGSNDAVYAVNESNGALRWTGNVNGVEMSAAVTVDGVYASWLCQTSDLRPATGEVIWQINAGSGCGGVSEMPTVANQLVYADNGSSNSSGNIYNAETGANEGSYSTDMPPAFTATMGYYLRSGTLRGVTLPSNTVQWSFSGDGFLTGSPIVVNQYVFIGSSSGNLYALNSTTGAQVWNIKLSAAIGASVQLPFSGLSAGDGLLVVPSGTTVTAYTLSTSP